MSTDAAMFLCVVGGWVSGGVVGYLLGLAGKSKRKEIGGQARPAAQVLEMKPSDTLVLTYSGFLTKEQREQLRAKIEFDLGGPVRLLVLEGGIAVDSVIKN